MKDKVKIEMPIRINFGGAWSDTPPFCLNEGGCVCNASAIINGQRPIKVIIEKTQKNNIIIENNGKKTSIEDLKELKYINPQEEFALEKIVLKLSKIECLGFKISIKIDNIPRGSGLGTSSILSMAILKAIYMFEEKDIIEEELINIILLIEKELETGGGWQDQAGAIRKGIKIIKSKPGKIQKLKIEEIKIDPSRKNELKNRFLLIYTGETRKSKEIVKEIMDKYTKSTNQKEKIKALKNIAIEMKIALEKGDIDTFAKLLSKNYEISKKLSRKVENSIAKQIFEATMDITSGKMICGAGNGGFVELILKKGISKQTVNEILEEKFPNTDIRVWEVELE